MLIGSAVRLKSKNRSGFTLLEILVALVILSLSLGLLLAALSDGAGRSRDAVMQERVASEIESHLDRLGTDIPIVEGVSTGNYASGATWRLSVKPYLLGKSRMNGLQVVLYELMIDVRWGGVRGEKQAVISTLKFALPR